MVTVSIAERVAAGVAWLDEYVDRDWHVEIDLGRLNLASCVHCILGQLYGHYLNAPKKVTGDGAPPLGFARHLTEYGWMTYPDLAAEWRRVIEERRAQTAGAS